jgi:hypothetical protein
LRMTSLPPARAGHISCVSERRFARTRRPSRAVRRRVDAGRQRRVRFVRPRRSYRTRQGGGHGIEPASRSPACAPETPSKIRPISTTRPSVDFRMTPPSPVPTGHRPSVISSERRVSPRLSNASLDHAVSGGREPWRRPWPQAAALESRLTNEPHATLGLRPSCSPGEPHSPPRDRGPSGLDMIVSEGRWDCHGSTKGR